MAIALFAVFSLSVLLYLNYYIFAVDERVDAELKTMLLDKARDSRSDRCVVSQWCECAWSCCAFRGDAFVVAIVQYMYSV